MKNKLGLFGLIALGLLAATIRVDMTPDARPAPDATFHTITGKRIDLKSLQGKPVIVTFWATDCRSCIEEIPHLRKLYQRYHPHGLEIIAVAMYYDPPSHVVAMTRAQEIPYDVALDLTAEHAKAFGDVRLTPTSFVIAPDGRIARREVGIFDLPDMKSRIEAMLKAQIAQSKTWHSQCGRGNETQAQRPCRGRA